MLDLFYKKCVDLKIHNNIYIGYSGGVDSSVLLSLCHNVFKYPYFKIKVIHISYSHNVISKNWYLFCKNQSNKYRVPMISFLLNSNIFENNLEEQFRIVRYNAFFNSVDKNSSLLLAHNASDLSETFFLNIFRGCGLNGILSIKSKIKYKNINILRPLLIFDRKQIFDYAIKKNINYIVDFSNLNKDFSRNFLRYEIYPLLDKKWIKLEKTIMRCINLLSFNNFYIYSRCKFFFDQKFLNNSFLKINYLKVLPIFIRDEILRLWIKSNNCKMPSLFHIIEINKLINCEYKFNQSIKIGNYFIKRGNKNIYIINIDFNKKNYTKIITNFKVKKLSFHKEDINLEKIIYLCKVYHIYNWEEKKCQVITYKNFVLIICGIWKSYFYICFLKKNIKIKILM